MSCAKLEINLISKKMKSKERLVAEKFLARLMPYIKIEDSGALLCAIHNQIKYQEEQWNMHIVVGQIEQLKEKKTPTFSDWKKF